MLKAVTSLVVFVLGAALIANAQIAVSAFEVRAANGAGAGSFSAPLEAGVWDDQTSTYTWNLGELTEIRDDLSGALLATLVDAEVVVTFAGEIDIEASFGVIAGSSDTQFYIKTPLAMFDTIPASQAVGRASASISLTDIDGNGALVMGSGAPGTGAFRAYINGCSDGGELFSHLISIISVSGGGTANASQNDPAVGYRPLGVDTYDACTEFAFTVSSNDAVFATSLFGTPEPEPPCLGDIDGDGDVDSEDLGVLLGAYGTAVGDPYFNPLADLDGSGDVNVSDLAMLLVRYGRGCD